MKVDLNLVEKEWISSTKPVHLKVLAEHYGIFQDLFGDYAFFYPVVHMNIAYSLNSETYSPVIAGNLLKPKEVNKV